MSFSDYLPSVVALVGIPAAAGLAWWRENRLRDRQERREDLLRLQQHNREDTLFRDRQLEWVFQQWWVRRADAYGQIIQTLWRTIDEDRTMFERELGERDNNRTPTDEERKQFKKERDELRQLADVGALVISEAAAEVLREYFAKNREIGGTGSFAEYLDEHLGVAEWCLRAIRDVARVDLHVDRLPDLVEPEPPWTSCTGVNRE